MTVKDDGGMLLKTGVGWRITTPESLLHARANVTAVGAKRRRARAKAHARIHPIPPYFRTKRRALRLTRRPWSIGRWRHGATVHPATGKPVAGLP